MPTPVVATELPSTPSLDSLLSIRKLGIRFGGVQALNDVSMDIGAHQVVGLIGPNGAGKTTLFNCLTGLYKPSAGEIHFRGDNLINEAPHRIARKGICRTFQNVASFHELSVRDNIRVGAHCRTATNFIGDILGLPNVRRAQRESDVEINRIISYFGLDRLADTVISALPLGLRKIVEIARALASKPDLLLLDEPAGGLTHSEVDSLGNLIRRICDERGITILLVEHHMSLVMSISDRINVLNFGRKLAEGSPEEIRRNKSVIEAYLGGATHGG
ncbi:ABC transporter ATP-binding protein [Bradyrhizobium manausense]